jgi:hypothetical protein
MASPRKNFPAEYRVYHGMLIRCSDPRRVNYKYYGGRGIRVCSEWIASFSSFIDYMGPRPSAKHTLDRYPNNDGNYEPGNVRWATMKEQTKNKRPRQGRKFAGGPIPKANQRGYERVLAHFHKDGKRHGAKTRLQHALGLASRQVVDRWQRYGIPEKYAGPLFKLTGMRPEEIWPENFR